MILTRWPVRPLTKMISRHEVWVHVILLGILYMVLDHQYRHFVSPLFIHLNFTMEIVWWRSLTALIWFGITMASFFLLKPSPYLHATSVVFIVLFLIPNLILYQYMPTNPAIPAFLVLFILLLRIPISLSFFTKQLPVFGPVSTNLILPVLTLLLFFPIIRHFGFSFRGFNLFTDTTLMYTVREELHGSFPIDAAYSLGQLTKALLPSLLLYGVLTRRYWMSLVSVLGIGYIFMVNPHKTFLIGLAPLLFFVFWKSYHRKISWFITLLVVVIFITMAMSHSGHILPESLLVRRSLFTQAFLTHAYFDFFNGAPVGLSHSFLESIHEYPYHLSPPFLIGEAYFCSPVMSCNTGFLGDGFMNFGYAGALMFLLLTVLIFHYIDALKLTPEFFGLTFLVIFQLQNTYLFTTLITHGLLVLLVIMTLILRKRET